MKNWPIIAVSIILVAAAIVFCLGIALDFIREHRARRRFNQLIEDDENVWHQPSFDSDGDPLHPEHLSPIEGSE